jgi:carbon monoxide dehydrogenase subunit G
MTTLVHEIFITAPPSKVWATLADLSAVQHYNPTVRSARLEGAQLTGIGACRVCELIPKGIATERVTTWQPEQCLGLEIAQSDWPIVFMRWDTRLAPQGGGTLVTQRMEYQVKFGPLGKLLDALVMRRKLDGTIADIFQRMKAFIESTRPA